MTCTLVFITWNELKPTPVGTINFPDNWRPLTGEVLDESMYEHLVPPDERQKYWSQRGSVGPSAQIVQIKYQHVEGETQVVIIAKF